MFLKPFLILNIIFRKKTLFELYYTSIKLDIIIRKLKDFIIYIFFTYNKNSIKLINFKYIYKNKRLKMKYNFYNKKYLIYIKKN